MKKILFLDRDGTLIHEPEDEVINSYEKLQFLPGVIQALGRIVRESDFELVMVTNQDGLGTEIFPEETFWPAHYKMMEIFEGEGITFREVLIDKSFPADGLETRKPGTGLVTHYMKGLADLENSWVIGDRATDVELAKRMGCRAIRIASEPDPDAVLSTLDWHHIADHLLTQPRKATIRRTTKETDIQVDLNLDGSGKTSIQTGIGFLDHMLEQVGKHGGIDLFISIEGDLHIDEHHVTEDCALAFGQAIDKALGTRKGIHRYGFLLPMDDALAQVAIDFGGRPWIVWNAEFRREKIGDLPTELFFHFFKSFSDASRCNLNIEVKGDNEHHKIEAVFKAFAKALGQAVSKSDRADQLPSTKGVL
jgi:imidazoleglycerol-phosphate dehydratase/histidinol-phosphatase